MTEIKKEGIARGPMPKTQYSSENLQDLWVPSVHLTAEDVN